MIFVDENGKELNPNQVMMLMGNAKNAEMDDEGNYYEDFEEEREGENHIDDVDIQNIINADYYIDDEQESKAIRIK